jgi:hypothetical protein
MGFDPGSEIQDPEKTYSGSWTGSRGQKDTGSRIQDPGSATLIIATSGNQHFSLCHQSNQVVTHNRAAERLLKLSKDVWTAGKRITRY